MRGDRAVLEERLGDPADVVDDDRAPRVDERVHPGGEVDRVLSHVVEVELGARGDVVDDLEHRGPLVPALGVPEDVEVGREVAALDRAAPVVDTVGDDADPDPCAGQAVLVADLVGEEEPVRLGRRRTRARHGGEHRDDLRHARHSGEHEETRHLDPGGDRPRRLVAVAHAPREGVDRGERDARTQPDVDVDDLRGRRSIRSPHGAPGPAVPVLSLHGLDQRLPAQSGREAGRVRELQQIGGELPGTVRRRLLRRDNLLAQCGSHAQADDTEEQDGQASRSHRRVRNGMGPPGQKAFVSVLGEGEPRTRGTSRPGVATAGPRSTFPETTGTAARPIVAPGRSCRRKRGRPPGRAGEEEKRGAGPGRRGGQSRGSELSITRTLSPRTVIGIGTTDS